MDDEAVVALALALDELLPLREQAQAAQGAVGQAQAQAQVLLLMAEAIALHPHVLNLLHLPPLLLLPLPAQAWEGSRQSHHLIHSLARTRRRTDDGLRQRNQPW